MQSPSTCHLERVEIWVDGSVNEAAKKVFQNHIVSYALKDSVNGVTCVFVVYFRSPDTQGL